MSVLEVEVADGVAVVTMNRPEKHNAIDPEMMVRLHDTWQQVADDPDIRVAVLTGAGSSAFSAGGDLRSLVPLLTRARPAADEWDERLLRDQRAVMNGAMLRRTDFATPLIAAVNGVCLAGGMELMLATDVRVASATARFALSEVQRGLIPGGGSVARLPRQVPRAVAMEMLMTGEQITADRGLAVGLLNEVVSPGDELGRALGIASRIARNAPLAVRAVKRVGGRSAELSLADAFLDEDAAVREIMRSDDAKEGARAFVERRAPRFTGR